MTEEGPLSSGALLKPLSLLGGLPEHGLLVLNGQLARCGRGRVRVEDRAGSGNRLRCLWLSPTSDLILQSGARGLDHH